MMENKQLVLELEAQNTKLSDRVDVSMTFCSTCFLILSLHVLDARAVNSYVGRRKQTVVAPDKQVA